MAAFPDGLQSASVNSVKLAYRERGSGAPVVFIHGSSQDLRTWLAQIGPLSEGGWRAIVYSRRYARPNDDIPPGQDDQMQPHVDDLAALLEALAAAPAHLVGTSWGGFIALLLAIQLPKMVRTLVLCEPPVVPLFLSNEPGPREILRLLARHPIDGVRLARFGMVVERVKKDYRAGDFERGGRAFGQAILGRDGYAALRAPTREMLDENEATEVAQLLGAGFPPLSDAEIRSVRCPVLLLAGERSPALFRKTFISRLEGLLPQAQRAEIPGAYHIMHEDNPQAFNATLLDFVRRHA